MVDLTPEAMLLEEGLVRLRAISTVGPDRRGGVRGVEQPRRNMRPSWLLASVTSQVRMKPWRRSMPAWLLYPKTGIAMSVCRVPSSRSRALPKIGVQRASRSFWRGFAGLSFHSRGTRPALISAFSAAVLRWRGAETRLASTIWPAIGMYP